MVIRVRRTSGRDEYGDPTGDETRQQLPDAWVAPVGSDDVTGRGREGVEVVARLFGPFDLDVMERDLIEAGGVTYRTVGAPARWEHPMTGWKAGCTIDLERAEG